MPKNQKNKINRITRAPSTTIIFRFIRAHNKIIPEYRMEKSEAGIIILRGAGTRRNAVPTHRIFWH